MSGETPVLELRKVCKEYGNGLRTSVLFDVNLKVMPGEFVGLVGASGSGKTTLLNIAGLLDRPTAGQVFLGGADAATVDDGERARLRREYIGFIFQFHYLLPEFTVLENALIPCRLRGDVCDLGLTNRMTEFLTRVGLGERLHYRPDQLSGGQQQRVAIVRSLANNPDLVLADEPTGNLDSKSGRGVFDLMRELNEASGKAFLMVTHDEGLAGEVDRIVHIVDGRIEEG
jgi:lipoprotein-releasing system ATP-binding protein